MDLEIRPVAEEEFADFVACDAAAFGYEAKDEDRAEGRAFLELDRTQAAFEEGRVVATSGNLSLELTLPGKTPTPTAGVTWVSVLPTHGRRGILTALMGRLLDDAHDRGEPFAALMASESVIYGRFGFGPATSAATYEIDRHDVSFSQLLPTPGRLTLLERAEAEVVVPEVFDRYRRWAPGEVSRSAGWWKAYFDDRESQRDDMSRRFYVVHERAPGTTTATPATGTKSAGRCRRTTCSRWATRLPSRPRPGWHCSRTAWSWIWSATSGSCRSPLEEPLRWVLTDPRRLETRSLSDVLWLRLVDVAAALGARRYAVEGRLVLEVDDRFRPQNTGRYELVGGPEGAECRVTSADADLSLGVAELGAVFLGGARLGTLAAAGRVREARPGALALASAMFATEPPAHCSTSF